MPKMTGEKASTKAAQSYFRSTERDEAVAKQIRKKERATEAAKTANLRRLRLEKEAADKQAAEKLATESGAAPAKQLRRKPVARKRTVMRIVY